MDLETVAEDLYTKLPGEFVPAREEWVRLARSAGETELARQIATLRKPTISAWVVNLLVHEQGDETARLLDLGDQLREAQQELKADDLRDLSRQRTRLVAALTEGGRRLAGEAGHSVSETVAREVATTLEAAIADPGAAAAVGSGRLTTSLSYSGLGGIDVSDAVAVPVRPEEAARAAKPSAPGHERVPTPEAARERTTKRARDSERARQAVTDAEDRLRRAELVEADALRAETEARAATEEAERRVAQAEATLEREREAAAAATRDGTAASRRVAAARREATIARNRFENAKARLDQFGE